MMGNMWCESTLKSNIVEKRCSLGDSDYTWNVDNGVLSKWQFMSDSYGYGLCQWTYSSRKADLYEFAKRMGTSIGDEQMQCEFCLGELKRDYEELYHYLGYSEDLATATRRICAEYERPAVNNFADRINAAQRFFNQLVSDGTSDCSEDSCPIELPAQETAAETVDVPVRVLRRGELGRDVLLLQCGLNDMGHVCGVADGDFGLNTETAVKELQQENGLEQTGIADKTVWECILRKR